MVFSDVFMTKLRYDLGKDWTVEAKKRMAKHYHAFLLRIWQVGDSGNETWLSSLEDPHTRKTVGFRSFEQLYEYIQKLTCDLSDEATRKDHYLPDQESLTR